jgi:hypothetical protein
LNFSNANLLSNEKRWDSVPLAGPVARGTLALPGAPTSRWFLEEPSQGGAKVP